MVNTGIGIGQDLEMLANEWRTLFSMVAQCCMRIYIVEQNQQLWPPRIPFRGMVFMLKMKR
jgi:sulfur transfer protein SufE